MSLPTFTYTFIAGTTIDSAQVNTNNNNMISNMTDGTRDFTIGTITTTGAATLASDVVLCTNSGDDVTFNNLTATTVPYIDGSKNIKSSAVTPTVLGYLASNSKWATVAVTGSFNVNCTYTGTFMRIFDTMHLKVNIAFTGAPNSTGCTITIPSSLTIDTTKLASINVNQALGVGIGYDVSTTTAEPLWAYYNTTTTVGVAWYSVTTALEQVTQAVPFTIANTDYLTINISVPILEWA